MGRYTLHQVPASSIPPISRTSAAKLEHPPGTFAAYHPDPLMAPQMAIPRDWVEAAHSAERKMREFESEFGESASKIGWVLQRSESLGSSTIEDVSPSLRRVARAEAVIQSGGDPLDGSAKEAVGSIAATRLASEIGDRRSPISIDDVLAVHAVLMEHAGRPHIAGRLRGGWVRIGGVLGGHPPPAYIAPPAGEVLALMDDLLAYINGSGDPPLVVAAVSHAQFESIHPFADGNGRTGRALIAAVLRQRGVTKRITVPISSVLAVNRDAYIGALSAFRYDGSPDSPERVRGLDAWVRLLASASVSACGYAEQMVGRVESVAAYWAETVGGRKGAAQQKMLAALPSMPVFTVQGIAESSGININTAYRAVRKLEAAGIVAPVTGKLKGRGMYEAPAMLDLFQGDPGSGDDTGVDPSSNVELAVPVTKAMARRNKADEAVKLRGRGLTHRAIGQQLGMSESWAQNATAGVPRGRRRQG